MKASRVSGGFLHLAIGSTYLYNSEKERGEAYERMEAF